MANQPEPKQEPKVEPPKSGPKLGSNGEYLKSTYKTVKGNTRSDR